MLNMNAKSFALTGLCFAMCQSPALESHASDIKVFLLGGQSNMLGRSSVSGLPASLQGVQSDVLLFGGSDGTAGTTLVSLQPEIMDQPTAALIHDMKRRGLLEHTLVVWCTEFGRMPFLQANGTGRDHNPSAFTCFLAGAGIKKGYSYAQAMNLDSRSQTNPRPYTTSTPQSCI